jgi:hypothetical protein
MVAHHGVSQLVLCALLAQLRLSRFKLTGPPTPIETEASNAYAVIPDSLGPVCIRSLIGINSRIELRKESRKYEECVTRR